MSFKSVQDSKFLRLIKVPVRVLARARDLYIQSQMAGGGHASYGNAMGCPTPTSCSVNLNSSFKSAEEELRELIRLASTHRLKVEAGLRRSKSVVPLGGGGGVVKPVPRRKTVAFGRIDEDKPFEFGEDEDVRLLVEVYPRNRKIKAA